MNQSSTNNLNFLDKDVLKKYLAKITEAANGTAIIFPTHHRTMKIINDYNINTEKLIIIEPLSYLQFNYLVKYSLGVITDSGGITEETTLKVGDVVTQYPGQPHQLIALEDGEVFEVSTEHFDSDSYRIYKGDIL